MSCSFLRRPKTQSVQATFGVANAWEASSNTTSVRLPEGFDHTRMTTARPHEQIASASISELSLHRGIMSRTIDIPDEVYAQLEQHVRAELAASGAGGLVFISADADLNDVAQAEHLSVQNPNDHV